YLHIPTYHRTLHSFPTRRSSDLPYLEKTAEGEHQLYMLGWSGTNGDPDYFLSSLLHGSNIGTSKREFYENSEVDKLLEQAKVSIDRKSTRLNSSHVSISYAVFCL